MRMAFDILGFLFSSTLVLAILHYGWEYLRWLESMTCRYADPKVQRCKHKELRNACYTQQATISLQAGQIVNLTADLNEAKGELLMLRLNK